jgi:hypothetical protein
MSQEHQAPTKFFRVTIIEWEAYKGTFEATNAMEAKALALDMWNEEGCNEDNFLFENCGFQGIDVEEILTSSAQQAATQITTGEA